MDMDSAAARGVQSSVAPAVLVLVLGVLSWVFLWAVVDSPVWVVVPAVVALTQARPARRVCRGVSGSGVGVFGSGFVVAGVVLSVVALVVAVPEIVSRVL